MESLLSSILDYLKVCDVLLACLTVFFIVLPGVDEIIKYFRSRKLKDYKK